VKKNDQTITSHVHVFIANDLARDPSGVKVHLEIERVRERERVSTRGKQHEQKA
jgi:hypothetical protein